VTVVEIRLTGAQQVSAAFKADAKKVGPALDKLVNHHGMLLRTRVMAKASGRPGPRAITGDYRRSWQHKHTGGGSMSRSEVGTNAAQGRRLEYGFNGSDSLGRVYNQPPFPHARPAFDETAPGFEAGGAALIAGLFK
jgi:hypothetical protein